MSTGPRWVHHFTDPVGGATSCPTDGRQSADAGELKSLLGGKGAGLKAMAAAGLHVPPGFTITTECCRRYFELDRTWPEGLEAQVRENLARLEEQSGGKLGRGRHPLLVSVRSGAAVSMPGMMDTLLNCGLNPQLADEWGDTPAFWERYLEFIRAYARTVDGLQGTLFDEADGQHEVGPSRALAMAYLQLYQERTGKAFPNYPWDVLVACINAVFDSWYNERAEAYRRHHDIRDLPGTAVNVQRMFPSEVSGIVFTQDPNDLAANQMIIESSYGLGEAVVSGDVSPDRFVVRRDDPSQVEATLGHKSSVVAALGSTSDRDADAPSLAPEQIAELCALALRVEDHFGHPVDVEWGLAGGQFALLQSRPIRGLELAREVELARREEIERLGRLADGRRRVWAVHNLAETLPLPTPLSWDIVRHYMRGSGGYGRLYQQLGYRPSRRVREQGFLELIGGRIYVDPERLAELFYDGIPVRYKLEDVLEDASVLDRNPSTFDPDKAEGRFLVKLPGALLSMWRAARRTRQARRDAKRVFEEQVLPPFLAYVEQKRQEDLSALGHEQLLAELDERRHRVLDAFGPQSLRPGFAGALALAGLQSLLVQLLGPEKGTALANTLTGALEGDTTFEQSTMLYQVATGEASLGEFLDRFGHRAAGEMELAEPRWREDPTYLERTIARLKANPSRSPQQIHQQNLEQRHAAEVELPSLLARCGGSSLRERIERDLAEARELLPYRESGRHYLMLGYELIRLATEELARRWDLGRDLYFLELNELKRYPREPEKLREEIARRRLRWQALRRLWMPELIDSQQLETLGRPPELQSASQVEATAVAAGVASGPARIVLAADEAGELGEGYILVCPSTDPGWTPLFLAARGLIVERGGVLSHGAIVARDFGIPAVVCPNATRLLKPGQQVRVDGNRGQVFILEEETADA